MEYSKPKVTIDLEEYNKLIEIKEKKESESESILLKKIIRMLLVNLSESMVHEVLYRISKTYKVDIIFNRYAMSEQDYVEIRRKI